MSVVGQAGHVSFLVLASKIVRTETVVQALDASGRPSLHYERPVTDGTVETGETACHQGTAIADAETGLIVAGYGGTGEPRVWRDVPEGKVPKARQEDPAGHVFHLAADCPEGRP